jgi:hypothetical protein
MSHHFGIRPWELELLTYDELRFYQDALAEMHREAQAAAAKRLK